MKFLRNIALAVLLLAGLAPSASAQLSPLTWGNFKNLLICGDFGTCPWQLGTTFGVAGNPVTNGNYTADQWFGNSVSLPPAANGGATFAMQVTQSPTAAIPTGYQQSLTMGRIVGFTTTAQMCLAQELETSNVIPLQGQSVTLSFYAAPGPNFSGTALVANIISGTGTDQGAAILALNQWTGQTTLVSTSIPFTSASTLTRYQPGTSGVPFNGLTATVPTNAKELAVEICYSPTGTAGAQDFVGLNGIQLEVGTTATTVERRSVMAELALAERYLTVYNEPGTTGGALSGVCEATGSSSGKCIINLPVPMRLAPTWAAATPGTFSISIGSTNATTITTGTNTTGTVQTCQFTNANTGQTAGDMEFIVGKGGTGQMTCNAQF